MERQTRQKNAVLQAIAASGRSLSPAEIWTLAQREVPRINLSTVYRQLKGLQEDGRVLRVDLPGQAPRFEALATPAPSKSAKRPLARSSSAHQRTGPHALHHDHHHHFHCLSCDQVIPIHACPSGIERIAPKGFEVQGHDLTLHGRCPTCATQTT